MNTISQNVQNSYIVQRSLAVRKSAKMQMQTAGNSFAMKGASGDTYADTSKSTAQEVSEIRRMLTGIERENNGESSTSAKKITKSNSL